MSQRKSRGRIWCGRLVLSICDKELGAGVMGVQMISKAATSRLLSRVGREGFNAESLARELMRKPELIAEAVEGTKAEKPQVKYGCAKVLRLVSERAPGLLYSHFDAFIELLDCENSFLKWGAILTVGNLAAVDSDGKIDAILDRFLRPICGPVMITAGNVIVSAAKIAKAKPELAGKIAREVLKVEKARYATEECRNVAIGHAIRALGEFVEHVEDQRAVVAFVRRQLGNSRNATRKKAEAFLKRWGAEEK